MILSPQNSSLPLHFEVSPQDKAHFKIEHELRASGHHYQLTVSERARFTQPIILRGRADTDLKIELEINVGKEAEVDFMEHWEGVQAASIELKIVLKASKNSQVRYIALESGEKVKNWKEERFTHADEQAKIRLFVFHFGAESILSHIEQNAKGRQAHIETWITTRRKSRQSMKLNYQHRFHDRQGAGRAHLQGVTLDESKLEMKGNIWIGRQGGGTDTHLEEKVLNLSPKAHVQALPGLEVDTNDVKAGHSAAVHNLNPEQLIYAQTRGLSEEKSRHLMMAGFLKKGLSGLKDLPSIHEKIHTLI